jgi:hypothetical protein
MPYKCERIKIQGTQHDRRVKITPEKREDILYDKEKMSQRACARKYGISRRMVQFIWYPEKLAEAKKLYKERRKDGRYYKKEKHTKAIREHRARKQRLYVEGVIKLKEEE